MSATELAATVAPRKPPAIRAEGRVTIPLAPIRREVRRARNGLANALAAWQIPGAIDNAILVASELVTNAVRHTNSTRIALTATHGDGLLLIEVHDESPTPPAPVTDPGEEECGRGLALVLALSSDWGWAPCGVDAKDTWAVLPVRNRHH